MRVQGVKKGVLIEMNIHGFRNTGCSKCHLYSNKICYGKPFGQGAGIRLATPYRRIEEAYIHERL